MCEFHDIKCPLDFLEEGLNVAEICEKMELSRRRVLSQYKEDFVVFIKQLVNSGKTDKDIEGITGIYYRTVRELSKEDENKFILTLDKINQIVQLSKSGMNPRGVAKELGLTVYHVHEGLRREIITRYLKLNALRNMKLEFRMNQETITKIIRDQGLEIHSGHSVFDHYGEGKFPYFKPISPYLADVIVGELLGDGHIREIKHNSGKYSLDTKRIGIIEYKNALESLKKINETENIENIENAKEIFNASVKAIQNSKVTSFSLSLKLDSSDWVRFVGKRFMENNYGISFYHDKKSENSEHKRQDMFRVQTKHSIQLQKIREKWYFKKDNGDNLKVVPKDLELNPNRVLHWYTGDGHRSGDTVGLSTEGFLEKDVRRLSDLLEREIKINSFVNKSKPNIQGEDTWKISFSSKQSVSRFFEYLNLADKEALDVAKKVFPQKFKR